MSNGPAVPTPNGPGDPIRPPTPTEVPVRDPDTVPPPTPGPGEPIRPPTPQEAPVQDPDIVPNPDPDVDPSIDEPGRPGPEPTTPPPM